MSSTGFRVVLLSANPEGFSSASAFLAAAIDRRYGDTVQVDQLLYDNDDLRHRRIDVTAVLDEVVQRAPDLIGLSWYVWNHNLVVSLADRLRRLLPGVRVVVGGPETMTTREEGLLALPAGTTLVFGEGEVTMCEIIDLALANAESPSLPTGTGRVHADRIERGVARTAAVPLADIPSPLLTGQLRDAASNWMPSYSTTRGCVFRCSFCAWQDGLSEREFPLDRVLAELDVMAGRGYDTIWFTDTIFGRNEARAMTIIEHLRGWSGPTKFGFELHARFLSPRLAEALAGLPLDFAAVGVQSLAPNVLRISHRSPKIEPIFDAVDLLYGQLSDKSVIHLDLIFGMPEQTLTDCFESVDTLLHRFPAATLFCSMLQLIPGTEWEHLRHQPEWICLPADGDYEVVQSPTLHGEDRLRVRDLIVGLDALSVARRAHPSSLCINAGQAEQVGHSLRGTRFHSNPTYDRRDAFGLDALKPESIKLLLAYAEASQA